MKQSIQSNRLVRSWALAALAVSLGALCMADESPGPSTRRTAVTITEVMYRPAPRSDGRNLEFVELYNSLPWPQDIGRWKVRGDVDFDFPSNTVIAAKSYLVLAKIPGDLQGVYGINGVVGPYSGSLPDGTGRVRLEHRNGGELVEVAYSDRAPWPSGADGTDHSIVLSKPSLGEGRPAGWRRSAWRGGSPGSRDPQPDISVVINEVQPGAAGFIELCSTSSSEVDLSAWILTDDFGLNKFRFPDQTRLEPGGFLTISEATLGWSIGIQGDQIWLLDPERAKVVDSLRHGPWLPGTSFGRLPDRSGAFITLEAATPSVPNAGAYVGSVVLNEIMYEPMSGDPRDEYLELHNAAGSAVDVSGWAFTDGISFEFPTNTVLASGAFLVVANDPVWLRAKYPHLGAGQVVGPFSGTLANGGERLALVTAAGALADEVSYASGGSWGRWAAGGGSSLERVQPRVDSQLASNWADSDETAKAPWTTLEFTGVLTNYGTAVGTLNSVNVVLLGEGECLLDDVEVLRDTQINVVSNGTFSAGLAGWTSQGNHSGISVVPVEGGEQALMLHTSGRGDTGPNRVRGRLTATLTAGKTATIRARARWLAGEPEMLVRLAGNYLEAYGKLELPSRPGTPGQTNSRYQAEVPPAILDVAHVPTLPGTNEPVVVGARIVARGGLDDATVYYRLDPGTNYVAQPMRDDGLEGDAWAGDGVWSARLPGQPGGALMAFYVAAKAAGAPNPATYPAAAPGRECLVRFGELASTNAFGTYRLWLARATFDRWSRREVTSNEPLPVTFVYGDERVVYSAGAWYAGSKFNPNFDSPTGRPCDYALLFPADEPVLGATDFRISWPGNLNSGTDSTLQAEQASYRIVEGLGLPFNHRRPVNFFVNGIRRNGLLDDTQRPSGDFVEEWFDTDGELYKIQVHYEPTNDGATQFGSVRRAGLERVQLQPGANREAHYRWTWPKRAVKGSANDYTSLFALIDTANLPETEDYTTRMAALVDVEQWMRIFAAEHFVGNWDSFGYSDGSNMYFYKPSQRKWHLCIWDMDLGLDQFSDPPTTDIFVTRNSFGNLQMDPTTQKFFRHAAFRRTYLRALNEALSGPVARLPGEMTLKFNTFRSNGITAGNPSSLITYVNTRSNSVAGQLRRYDGPLSVTTNVVYTTNAYAVVSGTAGYRAEYLRLNGVKLALNWQTVTNWSATVRLTAPTNSVSVVAFGADDLALPGSTELTLISTALQPPFEPRVLINEWMAANTRTLADPADGDFDDWFELYNPNSVAVDVNGYRLTDDTNSPAKFTIPAGYTIAPRGCLLVWADEEGAQSVSTGQLHVNFKLSREGETLAVYAPSGTLLDVVVFGAQQSDVSQGRRTDGGTEWGTLPAPTPGNLNSGPVDEPVRLGAALESTGALRLSWRGAPGRMYEIQRATDLAGDSVAWSLVQQVTAASEHVNAVVETGEEGVLFYRVLVSQ